MFSVINQYGATVHTCETEREAERVARFVGFGCRVVKAEPTDYKPRRAQ